MNKIEKKVLIYTKNGKEFQFECQNEFRIISISKISSKLIIVLFNYLFEIKLDKFKN